MSSQLNVDTIVDKAGSGGTNVKMANTSTYVSDGGAVTQNTVQGLIKVWTNFNGTGTIATRDSFNTASLTDNSTGSHSINFTNNFNAASWSGAGNCQQADTVNPGSSYMDVLQINRTQETSFAKVMTNLNFTNTDVQDAKYVQILLSGDLA